MRDEKLLKLKQDYMSTPIPQELSSVVDKAIKVNSRKRKGRSSTLKRMGITAASIAASAAVLAIGVNTSPVFAKSLSDVPILGNLVRVMTIREYVVNDDNFDADIKTPQIGGLDNSELEISLNKKYYEENKKLYEEFVAEMEDLKENVGGHMGVDSGYKVVTDTDTVFSIGRYVVNTVGSSSTVFKYDTIDKKNQLLITLPSLFKDNSYVDTISANIKAQMIEQYTADNNKFYWVEGIEQEVSMELFEKISAEQNFYINADNKLVISFDKYEVAPGYMGIVEFTIPTEVIADNLVGNDLIK